MRAIGYTTSLPIDSADSLVAFDEAMPTPGPRDLRIAVKAISVNPVDTKVRKRAKPSAGEHKILGYDAAGIVEAVGADVTLFKPGDEVFYAGSVIRPGTNSEFHLVDERIVGRKPSSLGFAEAAALPLTSITAWELLFDRLQAPRGEGDGNTSLLIVGAAGGVGSILTQLARRMTGLHIIATASRPETKAWCLNNGAHAVIDHSQPMREQIKQLKAPPVKLIASLTGTETHFPALVEILAPQGRIGLIDDPETINASLLKAKSASLHWEAMFARSTYQTDDMIAQHHLLNDVAD